MRAVPILAVVLLFVPGVVHAEPRAPSVIETDIAAVDGRIHELEKKIEEAASTDARMQTAREECDRLDAIYTAYRTRLVQAQRRVKASHKTYREQFRLATIGGSCNAEALWWSFCKLPYAGRLANWKWYGPFAVSFTKARNEFWARREALEAEKRAVAAELSHDTDLPSLGLGVFDDYFAFKRAYLKRKADCDGTVRPYFRDYTSFVQLHGMLERLKTRRAQLEEELAASRGRRPPTPVTERGTTGDARIEVLWPRAADLQHVALQDTDWGPKGLGFHGQVVEGHGVIEPGRLYRLVLQVGRKTFTAYGRGRAPEGQGSPTLTFMAVLPVRLGPFQLRLSIPEEPGIRPVTVSGTLVPESDAAEALAAARQDLTWAEAPRPDTDREEVQRDLCRVYCSIAVALMRLDRMEESVQMAGKVAAIVQRERPASKRWRIQKDSTWGTLSWIFTQEALARGDVAALEKIHLARVGIYREIIAEFRQRGKEDVALTSSVWLCDAYRELGDLIVLLTNDLDRARKHWRTGRGLMPTEEQGVSRRPEFDPVWFAP